MIEVIKPGPKIELIALRSLEARLGESLPSSYLSFLLATNGGYSHEYSVPYIDLALMSEQRAAIFHWLSACVTKSETGFLGIEEGHRHARGLLPQGVIPIAVEDGGDPIVLSLRNGDYGSIYLFITESPANQQMNKLATSFEEFLGKLKLTRRRA